MAAAARAKRAKESIRFLKTLPREHLRPSTFNLALGVCAVSRDVDACLDVMDRLGSAHIPADLSHYTTAIAGVHWRHKEEGGGGAAAAAAGGSHALAGATAGPGRPGEAATDVQSCCGQVLLSGLAGRMRWRRPWRRRA
jgi:hypothetical protein